MITFEGFSLCQEFRLERLITWGATYRDRGAEQKGWEGVTRRTINGAPYKETGQADKKLFKLLKKDQERVQQITWKITWNMYKYIKSYVLPQRGVFN